jgi:hypothetical protein
MKTQRKTWDLLPHSSPCSMAIYRRHPYVLLAALTFVLSMLFYGYHYEPFRPLRKAHPPSKGLFDGQWNFTRDARNLQMNDTQCDVAFPDLFMEIDRAVEWRKNHHISLREIDSVRPMKGYNRVMIYDNQVGDCYISNTARNAANSAALCYLGRQKSQFPRPSNLPRPSPRNPHLPRSSPKC